MSGFDHPLSRRRVLQAAASLALAAVPHAEKAQALTIREPKSLRERVAKGELPPMQQRLPQPPKKIDFNAEGKQIGRYGGHLRTLLGGAKDTRLMTVNEYARLIGFNTKFELEPDILERFDVEDDRVFTLKLRKNHSWSDGHPFTAEDFRYWWEDVATVPKLNEGAIDPAMIPGGKKPVFTVLDELTVRYEWPLPNPEFPLTLAGASPLFIYMPAHYMKQ